MTVFLGWCALVALGIAALVVVIVRSLKPLCRVSYYRFGVPERGVYRDPEPLAELESDVITLEPEDWWVVDEA